MVWGLVVDPWDIVRRVYGAAPLGHGGVRIFFPLMPLAVLFSPLSSSEAMYSEEFLALCAWVYPLLCVGSPVIMLLRIKYLV